MKHGARITAVVLGVALYAALLTIFMLVLLGPREVQTFGQLLRGDPCTADCSPKHVLGIIGISLPFVATLPAVIIIAVTWVRRRRRSDADLKVIDGWLETKPAVTLPDPEPEPEPQKFYRDRQGRLRPLKSAIEDDFPPE